MARIRSVHPGLFTDEAFAGVSMAARIMLIGLWTEADDNGVFEWAPLKLKMRIFPADDINALGLLLELKAVNAIEDFEHGKLYGAIRNFRKYQRPKSPKAVHPIPEFIKEYVGLVPRNGELEAVELDPFPQNGEISPQMEDGGDKMEEEGGKETAAAGERAMSNLPDYYEPSQRVFEAIGFDPADHRMWAQRPRVGEWLKLWDLELDILPTVSRMSVGKPPGKIKSLAFFEDAIADAFAARTKPLPIGDAGNVKPQSSVRASLERRLAGLGSPGEVCARADDDPGGVILEGSAA